MNKASVFFLAWSLFSVVVGMGCQGPEQTPQRSADETESHVVTLTVAQQQAIGLATAPTVAREVEPIMESFGRVIPRVQGRVQVTAPVAGRVTTQSTGTVSGSSDLSP